MDEVLIRLKDIRAGYEGRTVVDGVSLTVNRESFIGVIGPNGGGKTTIMRVLLGLLKPTAGEAWRKPGLKIGYMPQVVDIDKDFPITVRDVILMGRRPEWFERRPSGEDKRRAEELIAFARLEGVAGNKIGALSGGQRQRVMLCRALMQRPELLVLDEPVTYMDRQSETTLIKLLPELAREMAIVMVTHNVESVAGLATTIATVNGDLQVRATARGGHCHMLHI